MNSTEERNTVCPYCRKDWSGDITDDPKFILPRNLGYCSPACFQLHTFGSTSSSSIDDLYADAAEEQIAQIDTSDAVLNDLLIEFRDVRDQKKTLEDALKEINKRISEPDTGLEPRILAILNARGITSIRKDGVGLVSVAANPWPRVVDKEGMVAWLDANGHGALAPRNVNAQSLRSWVKEMKENGYPLPPPEVMVDDAGQQLRLKKS